MKITAIIQARMTSTRLPGKVLMPIPLGKNSKPLIQWIVDRVSKSKVVNSIIIATSQNEEDQAIAEFAISQEINYLRGDENDVLSRFVECINKEKSDIVIRLTGDNPVVDFKIMDEVILTHINHQNDYTYTSNLPTGMNFEVVSSECLIEIFNKKLSPADREHVTLYIRNSNEYRKEEYYKNVNKELKNVRLTVDYPSDYLVVSALLSLLEDNDLIDIEWIEKMLFQYPWLFQMNRDNIQKKQYGNLTEEIEASIQLLKKFDLEEPANVLFNYKKVCKRKKYS